MRLIDYLDKNLLIAGLQASEKIEALDILVRHVAKAYPSVDPEEALSVLLERENLGTTGIGGEVAVPHGKIPNLPKLLVLVANSREGVDFKALDQKPCRLFFLVLAPAKGTGLHLRILAQISRLSRNQEFCAAMLDAPDEETLWGVLSGA